MKFTYHPKNKLEKFGENVYNLLVDNFPQTFFVGGMVRDLLLNKKITDIDITTEATPQQILSVLKVNNILADGTYAKFGSVIAKRGLQKVEITTLRQDLPSANRYNHVRFINDYKIDSKRRDFTINALYLSPKNGLILDPQNGLLDLKKKQIKFIGNPKKRTKEDPLRIIRALRFCLSLNCCLEIKTKKAITENFSEIKNLTKNKIQKEIDKVKVKSYKNILATVINEPKFLDKHFK